MGDKVSVSSYVLNVLCSASFGRYGRVLTFDDVELVTATSKTCDRLAQVLWQHLQLPISLLATDKDFTNYSEKNRRDRERVRKACESENR